MTKSKDIKITIDRDSTVNQVGVNGRIFTMPKGSEITVDEGVVDALRNAGAAFTVSDEDDGALNAVSDSRVDPPLTGGPKVELGDAADDGPTDEFRVGNVKDDMELGDGVTAEGGSRGATTPGGEGRSDYNHDTGGASAPTPGSRDTIATSTQPDDSGASKKATRKRS